MASSFAHYTCCLVLLTVSVGRGDGLWEKKDRENLQYDIEMFRKIADKIDHEIEDFYDDYSSKRLKKQLFDSLLQKYKSNIVGIDSSKNTTWKHKIKSVKSIDLPVNVESVTRINVYPKSRDSLNTRVVSNFNRYYNTKADATRSPKWPKFEEILLQMGKMYDWKNDRWLKVKFKDVDTNKIGDSNVDVHEKHKFHYKMIKLNRSKNRRNVVVAVSAVR